MEDVSRFILIPNLGAHGEVKQKQWIIQSGRVSYQAWLCITKLSASYLRLCFATEGHSCVRFNYWWSYGFFIRHLSPCHQTQWIKWCEGMGAFFHCCGRVVPVRLHYFKSRQFKWPVQRYWNLFLHNVTTKHCKDFFPPNFLGFLFIQVVVFGKTDIFFSRNVSDSCFILAVIKEG